MFLRAAFERAEADFNARRYEAAVRGYLAVALGAPGFTRARFRIADALLNLGDLKGAKDVYKALAWHYIRSGHPLLGLVVVKMVLAIDPGYEDLLLILAEQYSSQSDRVDAEGDVELPAMPALGEDAETPPIPNQALPELLAEAVKVAANTEAIDRTPDRLPRIPLFSHLEEEAFLKVLGSLRLRRFADGERIITQGEPGDSFYMLADGEVVVSKKLIGKDVVLAHLKQGAVFGEMALVSSAPRSATVSAKGEVALLSLSRGDLEVHAGELDAVTTALRKFTRGRFLANLAATSPLFADLGRAERRELLKKFQSRITGPGDIVIEEGEAGRGLFLVLRGEYEVSRQGREQAIKLATLKSGEIFGEIALLRDAPTTATVTSNGTGEVLFLSRDDFKVAVTAHPTMHSTLNSLSTARLQANRLVSEHELITDDSKLLL